MKLTYQVNTENNSAWLVSKNNREFLPQLSDMDDEINKSISLTEGYRQNPYEVLAHDSLEHFSNTENANLQELQAFGCMLAHRTEGFLNGFGQDCMYSMIAYELINYIQEGNPITNNAYSREECSIEAVNECWENVKRVLANDGGFDLTKQELTVLKNITKAHMSRGYNHVQRVGFTDFSNTFYHLETLLRETIRNTEYYVFEFTVYVNFKQNTATLGRIKNLTESEE